MNVQGLIARDAAGRALHSAIVQRSLEQGACLVCEGDVIEAATNSYEIDHAPNCPLVTYAKATTPAASRSTWEALKLEPGDAFAGIDAGIEMDEDLPTE